MFDAKTPLENKKANTTILFKKFGVDVDSKVHIHFFLLIKVLRPTCILHKIKGLLWIFSSNSSPYFTAEKLSKIHISVQIWQNWLTN